MKSWAWTRTGRGRAGPSRRSLARRLGWLGLIAAGSLVVGHHFLADDLPQLPADIASPPALEPPLLRDDRPLVGLRPASVPDAPAPKAAIAVPEPPKIDRLAAKDGAAKGTAANAAAVELVTATPIEKVAAAPPAIVPQPPPIQLQTARLPEPAIAASPPAPMPTASVAPLALPIPPPAPAPPMASEAGLKALDRGKALIDRGDIAGARLFLRRATDAGVAEAALLLGATYDPRWLAAKDTRGVAADSAQARHWYLGAANLGASEAAQRLVDLERP